MHLSRTIQTRFTPIPNSGLQLTAAPEGCIPDGGPRGHSTNINPVSSRDSDIWVNYLVGKGVVRDRCIREIDMVSKKQCEQEKRGEKP